MARTAARIPAGPRISDFVSLGVLSRTFPASEIDQVLAKTGKQSLRERDLPARVVVYYVLALALFMQASYGEVLRCLLEGLDWLRGSGGGVRRAGKSGISQARTRLGSAPFRQLHDKLVGPVATEKTRGAWYRHWHLVSLDGSTLDVADNAANEAAFERPGSSRGRSAYPQIRFVSLVENGTHVLFGSRMDGCRTSEQTLAWGVLARLKKGMLCLADRGLFGDAIWRQARATGAHLLWRLKKDARLECVRRLADGSYLSYTYPTHSQRKHGRNGMPVRVIEYRLEGLAEAEPLYRLVTSILNPAEAPATELAALYHQRWEIESAFAELKTHLRGAQIVLRSKTPELVRQEFYGLLMTHFAIRGLMHEAALDADRDPDRLSFLHAVRVVRRKQAAWNAIPPSAQAATAPGGTRRVAGRAGGARI
jgi:hypothetical protein